MSRRLTERKGRRQEGVRLCWRKSQRAGVRYCTYSKVRYALRDDLFYTQPISKLTERTSARTFRPSRLVYMRVVAKKH
jgi:hypothetical protein